MDLAGYRLRTAPDDFLRELYELDATSERELHPGQPPPTFEAFVADRCTTPAHRDTRAWVIRDRGEPVGSVIVELDRSGDNDHLVEAFAFVLPARRRWGIAKQLLRPVIELADEERRRLLLGFTCSTVPEGAAFVRSLGAEPGLEERESELDLTTIDRTLVSRWLEEGPKRAPDYELLTVDGDVPDDLVDRYAALYGATSDAPRGSLDIGDGHRTPEQIRDGDRARRESGGERILCLARQRSSGDLAGWTELGRHPSDPEKISQYWTAVRPDHRGHGLGKWLKAAALARCFERWPDGAKITTGNAYTNAAMLAINDALGFRETIGWTAWQVPVEVVRAKLG